MNSFFYSILILGLINSTLASDKVLIRTNAEPSKIPAAYGRTSKITARVFNQNHNPIIGKEVRFSASLGIITAKDSTDENGIATARFEGVPINATAKIVVSLSHGNSVYTDTQEVKLSGIVVSLAPNVRNALCNETVPIRVFITDAEGKAVTKAKIQLTGIKDQKGVTGADGCFKTIVTSKVEKTITIKASSLGAESSCEVSFSKSLPEGVYRKRRNVNTVRDTIKKYENQLYDIYKEFKNKGSIFKGKVVIELTIMPDGSVKNASISQSTIKNTKFNHKVLDNFKKWKFKELKEAEPLKISYPFEFPK